MRRARKVIVISVCVILSSYALAAACGRGGRGYFSPDTLDCRGQYEWLLPCTPLPLYRGPSSTWRYPAVEYLIAEGFWSPKPTSNPRWFLTFQWNQQWIDGHTTFHHELGRNGEAWIEWTRRNPEMARALWPKVLELLRRPGARGVEDASTLMMLAQSKSSVQEFEEVAAAAFGPGRGAAR